MFITSYLKICEEKGVSPTTVLRQLKISPSSYANWKKGGEPTNPIKHKIAEYFEITVTELVEGKIEKPDTNEGNGLPENRARLLAILEQLPDDKFELVENLAKQLLDLQ